jgi:hypothetical protein
MSDGIREHRELVERLRTMRWPEATPAVRQRIWTALMRDLADFVETRDVDVPEELFEASLEADAHDRLGERRLRRHEFATAAAQGYSAALGARAAAMRGASRPQFA